ncbi:hypothetical protein V498_00481 [Pseudogymnoascus sp. VKM F-4517 (FW-2822)]|nr:hypothetical protein V498_00481 [Pseudogymnoascus sp. VKM F-4517 (FW-2822)]
MATTKQNQVASSNNPPQRIPDPVINIGDYTVFGHASVENHPGYTPPLQELMETCFSKSPPARFARLDDGLWGFHVMVCSRPSWVDDNYGVRQGDKETRRQGDKETRQGDKETRRQGDKETRRQGKETRQGDKETRRQDKETRRQGDKTRRQGDKETRQGDKETRRQDKETRRQGDKTRRQGDKETRQGDKETRRQDKETRRQGDKETRRQGDKETRRQGDKETRRQGDKETRRQGDKETRRQGDKETRRQGDKETRRQGDKETRRQGDKETRRQGDKETRRQGDKETRRQGDKETRRQGDKETRRQGDKETRRQGDKETRRQGDKETRRQGDKETRRQGDKETRRQGDKETRRQGDKETRRQGDKETRRQGDKETRRQGDKEARRQGDLSSTRGVVFCASLFLYLVTKEWQRWKRHGKAYRGCPCADPAPVHRYYHSPTYSENNLNRLVPSFSSQVEHTHISSMSLSPRRNVSSEIPKKAPHDLPNIMVPPLNTSKNLSPRPQDGTARAAELRRGCLWDLAARTLKCRMIILTGVRVLDVEAIPIDNGRGIFKVEGAGSDLEVAWEAELGPEEICKALSVRLASEGVLGGSATEGQENVLSFGLAVLDILSYLLRKLFFLGSSTP